MIPPPHWQPFPKLYSRYLNVLFHWNFDHSLRTT